MILSLILIAAFGCLNKSYKQGSKILYVNKISHNYVVTLFEADGSTTFTVYNGHDQIRNLKVENKQNISQPTMNIEGTFLAFAEIDLMEINSVINIHSLDANYSYTIEVPYIVNELIFQNNELIFLGASEFRSYSPTGVAKEHFFNLYSLNLINRKFEKIAELDSYSAHGLQFSDSGKVSFLTDLRFLLTFDLKERTFYRYDLKKFSENEFFMPSAFSYNPKTEELVVFSNYRFYSSKKGNKFIELLQRVNNGVNWLDYNSEDSTIIFKLSNDNMLRKYDLKQNQITDFEL